MAEVSLQPLTSVNEGDSVPAVVDLMLPPGGSAIPITVTLATMDGTAGMLNTMRQPCGLFLVLFIVPHVRHFRRRRRFHVVLDNDHFPS